MEKKEKIYCGSGKIKNPKWFQATLIPKKFKDYIQEYEGNEFIKININLLDTPDKYGKNVFITIDTWKPDADKTSYKKPAEIKSAPDEDFGNLPF